uniref:Uncharacterized protein n=1 Tax=Botryosphaeria dothidea RNA virus 1 TaxID=2849745 RepID=A0A068LMA5_9VIRU|nr:hypothetical protein [Botryosphaeria dothidea RNA virus 1]
MNEEYEEDCGWIQPPWANGYPFEGGPLSSALLSHGEFLYCGDDSSDDESEYYDESEYFTPFNYGAIKSEEAAKLYEQEEDCCFLEFFVSLLELHDNDKKRLVALLKLHETLLDPSSVHPLAVRAKEFEKAYDFQRWSLFHDIKSNQQSGSAPAVIKKSIMRKNPAIRGEYVSDFSEPYGFMPMFEEPSTSETVEEPELVPPSLVDTQTVETVSDVCDGSTIPESPYAVDRGVECVSHRQNEHTTLKSSFVVDSTSTSPEAAADAGLFLAPHHSFRVPFDNG